MASVTRRLAELHGGRAYVEVTYDDADNLVTRIAWSGMADRAVRITARRSTGVLIVDTTAARGNGAAGLNRTGAQRFDWQTVALNLAA